MKMRTIENESKVFGSLFECEMKSRSSIAESFNGRMSCSRDEIQVARSTEFLAQVLLEDDFNSYAKESPTGD